MPKAASSFSPLRLFSPVQLVFCFILFFLPWIEMTCTIPPSQVKNIPKDEVEKTRKEFGIDPTKPVSMVSQTGLQIATGGSSPRVRHEADRGKDRGTEQEDGQGVRGAQEDKIEKPKGIQKDKDDTKGAPLRSCTRCCS